MYFFIAVPENGNARTKRKKSYLFIFFTTIFYEANKIYPKKGEKKVRALLYKAGLDWREIVDNKKVSFVWPFFV